MKISLKWLVTLLAAGALVAGCKEKNTPPAKRPTKKAASRPAKRVAKVMNFGVDKAKKTVTIGALNDKSGPAAAIGKPFALGKKIVADLVNAGKSGILPEGWKVKLEERDHGYNPNRSVQLYNEIKDKVLFIATSFGTPNTLPLRSHLKRDKMIAYPASLSSKMAEHTFTPPLATSYQLEAMRAMDWVMKKAKKAKRVRAAIVYQQDDYGQDGLEGWRAAAKKHGVKIVAEKAIAPTDRNFAAVITGLKKKKANYILLAVLPSATPRIIGTAFALRLRRATWIGLTPSWVDAFFRLPKTKKIFARNFYWVSSLPYWGEKVPGMKKFLAAYEKYGKKVHPPGLYILLSYIQGLVQMEVLNRAIKSGDVSRAGLLKALKSIKAWDAGKMIQPLNLSKVPYVTSTQSRILQPLTKKGTWKVIDTYATPKAYKAAE